jgi:DNA-directed RNA polymerase subunit H (RpoH/RPB5)
LEQRCYGPFERCVSTNDKLETNGFEIFGWCEADASSSSWSPGDLALKRGHRRKNAHSSPTERVLFVGAVAKKQGLDIANMHALVDHMTCEQFDRCVLISGRKLCATAVEYLQAVANRVTMEIFKAPLLNLPDHKLVPRHVRMQPKEEKAFLKLHSITDKQVFARMLTTDAIAHYFAFPVGSLIKVTQQEDVDALDPQYFLVCL